MANGGSIGFAPEFPIGEAINPGAPVLNPYAPTPGAPQPIGPASGEQAQALPVSGPTPAQTAQKKRTDILSTQFGDDPIARAIGGIGLVFQEFSAGFRGLEGPIAKIQEGALKRQQLNIQRAMLGFKALDQGVTLGNKLPKKDQAEFAKQYAAGLNKDGDVFPQLEELLLAALERPDASKLAAAFGEHGNAAATVCQGERECMIELFTNPQFVKTQNRIADAANLETIPAKVQAITRVFETNIGQQALAPFRNEAGEIELTMANIAAINANIPSNVVGLTRSELRTLRGNLNIAEQLGIKIKVDEDADPESPLAVAQADTQAAIDRGDAPEKIAALEQQERDIAAKQAAAKGDQRIETEKLYDLADKLKAAGDTKRAAQVEAIVGKKAAPAGTASEAEKLAAARDAATKRGDHRTAAQFDAILDKEGKFKPQGDLREERLLALQSDLAANGETEAAAMIGSVLKKLGTFAQEGERDTPTTRNQAARRRLEAQLAAADDPEEKARIQREVDELSGVIEQAATGPESRIGQLLGLQDALKKEGKTESAAIVGEVLAQAAGEPVALNILQAAGKLRAAGDPEAADRLLNSLARRGTASRATLLDVEERAAARAGGREKGREKEKARVEIFKQTQQLASLSTLIAQAKTSKGFTGIRGKLISDLGGLIQQFAPDLSKDFAAAVAPGASPEAVKAFQASARAIIAQNLTALTGEESGRFTAMEQQITQRATALLDAGASQEQVVGALSAIQALKVVARENKSLASGHGTTFQGLDTATGIRAAATRLKAIGLTREDAGRVISTIQLLSRELKDSGFSTAR
jgi:hypothetical protein|tara:strand:- start:12963 stop:15407 length:2445 start_codon:yes stop_codon:yes gene_type:complete